MKKINLLLLVFLPAFFLGCQKQNQIQVSSPYDSYFKGKIDGEQVFYKNFGENSSDQNFTWNNYSGEITLAKDGIPDKYIMTEDIKLFITYANKPSISVGYGVASNVIDYDLVLNKLNSHEFTYATPIFENSYWGTGGIFINYTDKSGVRWSTFNGTQDNSSFSFELLPSKKESFYRYIWKCCFSCNLYNKKGEKIKVENAEFYAPAFLVH